MKRELTPEEVQGIIKQEDECGMNTLLQELFCTTNPIVTADVDEKGGIGFYDVKERDKNETQTNKNLEDH